MLNTFILMLALASNPADAKKHHQHKHHERPKAVPTAHVAKSTYRPTYHHHARHVLVWQWRAGYYDIYGHWNRGKWILIVK